MFTTYVKTKAGTVLSEIKNNDLAGVWKTEFEERINLGPHTIGKVGVITKDDAGHTVSRHTHDEETGAWLGPFKDEPSDEEEMGFV